MRIVQNCSNHIETMGYMLMPHHDAVAKTYDEKTHEGQEFQLVG